MKKIKVHYFALFREQAGRSSEEISTHAATARDLYTELAEQHDFSFRIDGLRVAINDEFASWSSDLADGDRVVFIQPVAGG